MLRKLLAAAFFLVVGYFVGLLFGFRTAVVDYVENDAQQIEAMASDIYPSDEGESALPEGVRETVEQMESTGSEGRGFQ